MEMCREPGVRQVLPCGVFLFDQPHLACANPALELLLTGDGVANIAELFEVNQPRDAVPARDLGSSRPVSFLGRPVRNLASDSGLPSPFLQSERDLSS